MPTVRKTFRIESTVDSVPPTAQTHPPKGLTAEQRAMLDAASGLNAAKKPGKPQPVPNTLMAKGKGKPHI